MAKSGTKHLARWLGGFLFNGHLHTYKASNSELHRDLALLGKPVQVRPEGYMTMLSFGNRS